METFGDKLELLTTDTTDWTQQSTFVVKIRKQNGEEFEPDTLTSFSRSFDRFLREQGKHSSRAGKTSPWFCEKSSATLVNCL